MVNMIIQENGKERTSHAVHGEIIVVVAPCHCDAVTGVQIAGVAFPFYDACGNCTSELFGKFSEGSLVQVLIDVANTRAQILNHAIITAEKIRNICT